MKIQQKIQQIKALNKKLLKLTQELEDELNSDDNALFETTLAGNMHNYSLNIKYTWKKLETSLKKRLDDNPFGD